MIQVVEQSPARYCADEVRRHDNDRYLTTLFAPSKTRERLFALHAFNVELARVRESVSGPLLGQVRLRFWHDSIAELFSGAPRRHPVMLALSESGATAWANRADLERLIAAREFDLCDEPPSTTEELEGYASSTAGTLAMLGLEALGVTDEVSKAAARYVALAAALSGLLRAVPFHARARRLYLPADLMARHGLEREALFAGQGGAALTATARDVGAIASRYLDLAWEFRRRVPRAALPALLQATLVDRDLARLERCGFDPFSLDEAPAPFGRQIALLMMATAGRY